jgi:hypothetical protein
MRSEGCGVAFIAGVITIVKKRDRLRSQFLGLCGQNF